MLGSVGRAEWLRFSFAGRRSGRFPVQGIDHGDATCMAAPGKRGTEEHPHDLAGEALSDEGAAQGQYVRVVMLTRVLGCGEVVALPRPAPSIMTPNCASPHATRSAT